MNQQRQFEGTPQEAALHYARRLDDLAGVIAHLCDRLDTALTDCGGDVQRDVAGPLGRSGLFEQFDVRVTQMFCGTRRDSAPAIAAAVERALAAPRRSASLIDQHN